MSPRATGGSKPPHTHLKNAPVSRRWRLGTLAAFAAASALAVTSALQADGLDLRATSVTDLHTLVQQRRDQVDDKQDQVAALNAEVERLARSVDDRRAQTVQRQVRRLRAPAGFAAASGAGLKITLSDTPKERANELLGMGIKVGDRDLIGEDLVVHQQDLQSVINALWAGGARSMTLMGQRIISTTAIKCVGNTVVIKDIPYAPPYKIEVIGDPVQMQQSLYANDLVIGYLDAVSALDLVWSLDVASDLKLPAYTGTAELRYAKPAKASTTKTEPETD